MKTERLTLRAPVSGDTYYLAVILSEPEVALWWHGYDEARIREELVNERPDVVIWILEHHGEVIGAIQLWEQTDPDYFHAGIDLFVSHMFAGKRLGTEAIEAVKGYAIDELGHHRLVVDPAADNDRARNAYKRCGFEEVGVMRKYEAGPDGEWRDGVLMEFVQ